MTTPRVVETRRHGQPPVPQISTAADRFDAALRAGEPRALQAARRLRWVAGPVRERRR